MEGRTAPHWPAIIVPTTAVASAALGAAALIGWALDIPVLRSLSPALVSMKANTALVLVSAGLALWLLGPPGASRARRWGGRAAAAVPLLIGLLTLAEYVTHWSPDIDQLLFQEPAGAAWTVHPGRPAPTTAFNFLLLGSALFLLDRSTWRWGRPVEYLAALMALLALWALVGYVFSHGELTGLPGFTRMALPTALGFLALALGLILARTERGFARLLTSASLGGTLARRLIGPSFLLLLGVGWARLAGERAGLYDTALGVALMVTVSSVLLTALILVVARQADRVDTERHRAEQSLQLASAYNRSLLEASLDPLVTIDANGKIMDVNAATEKATGCARQELLGTDFSDYFTEPDKARASYQQVLREGSVQDYALEVRRRDGHRMFVRYNASIYRDAAGEARGVFAAARDITSLRLAEENLRREHAGLEQRVKERTRELAHANERLRKTAAELARSNKSLEEFAYVASHDLRAPLRAIKSLVQWMEEDLAATLDADNRERMTLLLSRVERLDRLISDLLEYSRAGRLVGRIRSVDTGQLVDEIVELLAPAKGFEVLKTTPLPVFETASAPLQQVLRNLIDNALKHHDRLRGRIEVSAVDAGECYEFSVSDDGPGIPAEFQERVFRLFETLKSRDVVEGSGVGLAVVRRTLERLDGRITLASNGERGTTFRFTWPKAWPAGLTGDLPPAEPAAGSTGKTAAQACPV